MALFIEGHHHYSSPVLLQKGGVLLEERFAHLQGNAVHDRFALAPLQPSQHYFELRCVQHERHLGDFRLRHGDLHELLHRGETVEHSVVDIDVDHVSSIGDLLLGDVHSLSVLAGHDQLLELNRPGYVAPFTDIQERHSKVVVYVIDYEIFQTGQPHLRAANRRQLARLVALVLQHLLDSSDVCWR